MAIKIKDPGTLSKKWVTRAQAAQPDYVAGPQNARTSQSAAAIAAGPTWQQAVASADALKRFQANLAAVGDAGWAAGIATKGAARYAPGVAAAQNKWQANVTPYLQALAGLTLPARGIRGSAQNLQRVSAVDQAMQATKATQG
jgi:hypothetical protein